MQRQSKFGGEEDPSVDEEKHDTYDELSESDDDNQAQPARERHPAQQLHAQDSDSEGALSQSDLNFDALTDGQKAEEKEKFKEERMNIMAQLGEFSMSGLTCSNIGVSQLRQDDKNAGSGIEELSEISSAIRKEDS